MLAFARDHNTSGDRCRFHLNVDSDLRLFETGSFDLVVCLITLQHMPPWAAKIYIAEMIRVTRPGGVVALQMPESKAKINGLIVRMVATIRSRIHHWVRGNPRMEMHARPADDIARIVRSAGGKLVKAIPDRRCGDWGPSLLHVVVKEA
jgi:ubiquinone/menaquinone biosynthesis C-methylase UbiE